MQRLLLQRSANGCQRLPLSCSLQSRKDSSRVQLGQGAQWADYSIYNGVQNKATAKYDTSSL